MRRGIDIIKYFWGRSTPSEVVVSFSLAYPDWCKLRDSETWRRFELLLEEIQTGQGSSLRRGFEAEQALR